LRVNGTAVTDLQMQVQGGGNFIESSALPTAVPVFRTYQTKRVIISTSSPAGLGHVRRQSALRCRCDSAA
jgi:hypothetical protein